MSYNSFFFISAIGTPIVHMQAWIVGQWKLFIDACYAPIVYHFSEDSSIFLAATSIYEAATSMGLYGLLLFVVLFLVAVSDKLYSVFLAVRSIVNLERSESGKVVRPTVVMRQHLLSAASQSLTSLHRLVSPVSAVFSFFFRK